MGLHLKQLEERSELQQRLDAELRAKAAARAKAEGAAGEPSDSPDGVEDSAYIENTKETTLNPAWVTIGVVFFIIIVAFIWLMVK